MIHISDRNEKIGRTGNISLPPIASCFDHPCWAHCYAVRLYRRPAVKKAWDDNLEEVQRDRKNYFTTIRRYLLKQGASYFRWHVSGDILDQDYFEQMKRIAKDFYFIQFLVFTKGYHLNFDNIPNNLSVIVSVWPGVTIPELGLPLAFVNMENENRSYNCLACTDDCETCRICWNLMDKNVVFRKH